MLHVDDDNNNSSSIPDPIAAGLHSIPRISIFGKLAPKRGRSKSKPRPETPLQSRASPSRSRSRRRHKRPDFTHFVIPLAGILSSVTARLYDMGATSRSSVDEGRPDEETAPLIPRWKGTDSPPRTSKGTAKTVKGWVLKNVAVVFMGVLILGVVVVLCVFFGCECRRRPRPA